MIPLSGQELPALGIALGLILGGRLHVYGWALRAPFDDRPTTPAGPPTILDDEADVDGELDTLIIPAAPFARPVEVEPAPETARSQRDALLPRPRPGDIIEVRTAEPPAPPSSGAAPAPLPVPSSHPQERALSDPLRWPATWLLSPRFCLGCLLGAIVVGFLIGWGAHP